MIFAELLTLALKITNYEKDATAATTRWPDTTHYKCTVPAGKRWFLFGGTCNRNVSSTMAVWIKDASDNPLLYLAYHAAASSDKPYPIESYTGAMASPFPMDAGEYLEIVFGSAQDAGTEATCVVLEIDV